MADLEAVLADVSYLMALEKSKSSSTANKNSKRMVLPDHSVRSVMTRYLLDRDELKFETLIKQKLAFLLFKDFCIKNQDIRFELYDKIDKLKLIHDKLDRHETQKALIDTYFFNSTLMLLISKPIVYSETIVTSSNNTNQNNNNVNLQQSHHNLYMTQNSNESDHIGNLDHRSEDILNHAEQQPQSHTMNTQATHPSTSPQHTNSPHNPATSTQNTQNNQIKSSNLTANYTEKENPRGNNSPILHLNENSIANQNRLRNTSTKSELNTLSTTSHLTHLHEGLNHKSLSYQEQNPNISNHININSQPVGTTSNSHLNSISIQHQISSQSSNNSQVSLSNASNLTINSNLQHTQQVVREYSIPDTILEDMRPGWVKFYEFEKFSFTSLFLRFKYISTRKHKFNEKDFVSLHTHPDIWIHIQVKVLWLSAN